MRQTKRDDPRIVLVIEKIEPPFVWPKWVKSGTWAAQNVKGAWFLCSEEPKWSDHGKTQTGGWTVNRTKKLRMDANIVEDIKFPTCSIKESKRQKP